MAENLVDLPRPARRRTGRAVAAVTALVVVAAGAAACSSKSPRPDAGPGSERTISKGDRYVALGDSYTTGYLTGPTDAGSGGCLRSTGNYAGQVAQRLGLELTDVSCGGATTENVEKAQTTAAGTDVEPQIRALDAGVDLVTIGLGANDFDAYGGIVVNCVQIAVTDPTGAPCTKAAATQGGEKALEENADSLRERLVDVVGAVLAKAPKARVMLVGYPQTFPASGTCEQLPLARGDYPLAHRALQRINAAVRGAAKDTGAGYVDIWSGTKDHGICAAEPWIAGATPTRTDGYAYHPYPEEQRAVADLITEALTSR